MVFTHNLKVDINSFDCCGSASVTHWYGDNRDYSIKTDQEGIEKLIAVETILIRDRRNLAIAVLNHIQASKWLKYLGMRGWVKVGESVKNSKTDNRLETWMLDMTHRTVIELEKPKLPEPVNGFNGDGVRLDRRDDPRTASVGPRTAESLGWARNVKEYFMDINGHRVNFVDLPVFSRGTLRDSQLNFYSIRLANGGNSYSWLQGGRHRFPQPPLVIPGMDDINEDEEDL